MRPLVLAALLPLAACNMPFGDDSGGDSGGGGIAGSGSGNTLTFDVKDFTEVDLRGPDDVDVRVGSGFSVRAEGDEDALGRLKIERVGDALRVGRVRRAGLDWSSGPGVKVFVTMPRIAEASIAGSGDMMVDRVEGARAAGSIAGSGDLTLGGVAVERLDLDIAGSGTIHATGQAKALDVSIAGSGSIDAPQLASAGADISIAGSGDVRASVDGEAKINIMGSGNVDLGPKARCRTNKMGVGDISCGR